MDFHLLEWSVFSSHGPFRGRFLQRNFMETEEDSFLIVPRLLAKSNRMRGLFILHKLRIEGQRQSFTNHPLN